MSFVRFIAMTAAAGTILLAVAACDDSSGSSANDGSADASFEIDIDIPSEEEADADAAREITAENADQAFEELSAEIEAELQEDDGG